MTTTMNTGAASDEQWYDLAQRHANADWNSNGYLDAIKAVCADYAALSTATPQADAAPMSRDQLADLIEGMEVSVDVSTSEHDAGNRIFGTITEAMDNPGSKHGVILLVQNNIERNFDEPAAAIAAGGAQEAMQMLLSKVPIPPNAITFDG
jgi:hypothetical protein